jgi:hypothetical protein
VYNVEASKQAVYIRSCKSALWRYFLELHGDRGFKDDKAMIGGLGKIGGQSLIVGQQKDITRRPVNTETSGWQIQKDIESAALDENGREVYSCSDAYRYSVLIQGWKRKNADKVRLSPEIYLKWYV